MTDRGLFGNISPGAWTRYKPEVRCAGTGGETQPFFDTSDGTYQFGRWLYDPLDNLVSVQIQTEFIGTTTVGAGAAYVWQLPMKARRMSQPNTNCPAPIGRAMCYFSFNTNPFPAANMPCTVTLADPHASLAGAEDHYCQAYAPRVWDWGDTVDANLTALQINNGSSSMSVAHRLKTGVAPNASAIHVQLLSTFGSTLGIWPWCVQNISSTTFDVKVRVNNSGTGAQGAFSYKIDDDPPSTTTSGALVSPSVPWDWTRFTSLTPFGNVFIELEYEPA